MYAPEQAAIIISILNFINLFDMIHVSDNMLKIKQFSEV